MAKLLLILGRPGSGKTTFVGMLNDEIMRKSSLAVVNINDRDVLLSFARAATYPALIRSSGENNFTVLDETVFDMALREVSLRPGHDATRPPDYLRKRPVRDVCRA
jgi:energy-coupling factor transporter ATP-binding protein EcfA2